MRECFTIVRFLQNLGNRISSSFSCLFPLFKYSHTPCSVLVSVGRNISFRYFSKRLIAGYFTKAIFGLRLFLDPSVIGAPSWRLVYSLSTCSINSLVSSTVFGSHPCYFSLYSGHLSPHISQLQKSGSPRQNLAETVLTRAGFERAIATRNQHSTTYRRQSNTVGKNSAETVLAGFERAIATRNQQQLSVVWNAFRSVCSGNQSGLCCIGYA